MYFKITLFLYADDAKMCRHRYVSDNNYCLELLNDKTRLVSGQIDGN